MRSVRRKRNASNLPSSILDCSHSGISPYTNSYAGVVMPLYDYDCSKCDQHWADNVPYEKRLEQKCPFCGADAVYKFPAPLIAKASFPDGHRRFGAFKEANKLNREAIDSKDQKKKQEIAKEIRKLGVRVTKE